MAKKTPLNTTQEDNPKKPVCGIIMPISAIDNCSAEHWSEILEIIKEVVTDSGFEPNLVSDADDSGVIQKRIIQNIYSNEIVICDVSGKNPNVMFELGMRLAFDKATVIIKDDKTDYSFDTGVIEHLGYPRDLRFSKIVDFKGYLKKKLKSTFEKSQNEPDYSTFLKNFGNYKIANIDDNVVSSNEYIISSIDDLRKEIIKLNSGHISEMFEPTSIPLDKADLDKFAMKELDIYMSAKGFEYITREVENKFIDFFSSKAKALGYPIRSRAVEKAIYKAIYFKSIALENK